MFYKSRWFAWTLSIILVIIIALLYLKIPLNISKFLLIVSLFLLITLSIISPGNAFTIFFLYFIFERRIDLLSSLTISTTEIGLLSIIVGAIVKEKWRIIHRYRLFIPIFLLIIWFIVISITSFDRIATLKQGIRYIEGFLAFFALYFLIDKTDIKWIFRVFLPVACITCIVGILQVFLPILREVFPPPAYNQPAVLLHNLVRAYSTFDHPNYLGVFLIPPFLISLGIYLSTKDRRFIMLSEIVIIAMAVILSLSRGSWIIMAIFSIVILCIIVKKHKLIISNLLILLTIVFITLTSLVSIPVIRSNIKGRISEIKSSSQYYMDLQRLYNFKVAFKMISEKPITGWGSFSDKESNIEYIRDKFYIVDFAKNRWGWTHNLYLQVAVDFGLVGFILFMVVLIQIIIISRKGMSKKGLLALLILSSFIALLLRATMETVIGRSLFIYTNIILVISNKIERNDRG
jgi:O-antigen ligase